MTRLRHDLHVHSTWSDGKAHPVENLIAASNAGITSLAMVEHVNAGDAWVPLWAEEVAWYRDMTELDLLSGVEAKLLDVNGTLDLPHDVTGIDMILVADHLVPSRHGLRSPIEMRAAVIAGQVDRHEVIADLVDALLGAAVSSPRIQIAHLFSCLPKIGISEQEIPANEVDRLAEGLAAAGVAVEISERWHCPSARVALVLADAGVRLVAGTDSHRAVTVGVFDYVADVMTSIDATPSDLHADLEAWRALWS